MAGSSNSDKRSQARQKRVAEDSDDEDEPNEAVVKLEAMNSSGRAAHKDYRDSETGSINAENNDENDPGAVQPSSNTSKKRRLDSNRQNAETDDEQVSENNERPDDSFERTASIGKQEIQEMNKPSVNRQPRNSRLPRDPKDGYVMGSIVRIKCHNFLTYFDIECMPGAHLNMIFGPNGSGKSSLAAAIAVGLGYSAKVMGRSKDLKQFVREGCADGYVEIELKGKTRRDGISRNLVVQRHLQAKNNSSSFQLQGQAVTQAAVIEAVKELNVNVDNLCSFLPQDRVAAFSQLTGPELLKETQRVSNPKLLDQQEQLADLKKTLDNSESGLEKMNGLLGDKEKKLNSMERDVKRHKEKQKIEDEVAILQFGHPYALYIEEKARYDISKRAKNEAKERLDALTDNNAPLVEQRDNLNAYVTLCEKRVKLIRNKRDEASREQVSHIRKIGSNEQEVEKLRASINELKTAESSRKKEMGELEKAIQMAKKQLQDDPPEADDPELNRRLGECQKKLRELKEEVDEIQAKHYEVMPQIERVLGERSRTRDALGNLDNVFKRREANCAKEDPQLWTATTWLRDHRKELKDYVYDPIRLLISAKDRKYAKVAEATINYATMKTIVCLDAADYIRLGMQYTNHPSGIARPRGQPVRNGDRDLRMNLAELPLEKRKLASYAKPCSQEELSERWGFDAFAIDLIEGPEHILAYLCATQFLHQVPVAFDDGRRISHDALREPGSPFRKYVTSHHVTTLTFSRYGDKQAVAQDVPTKDAHLFAETIDQTRKQELELRLAELDSHKEQLQTQRDQGIEQERLVRDAHEPVYKERTEITEEKKRLQDLRKEWEKTKLALSSKQQRLNALQKAPSEDSKRRTLVQQMAKLTHDRLMLAGKLEKTVDRLMKCHIAETNTGLTHLQASADALKAKEAVIEANEEMSAAVAEFEDLNKRTRTLFLSAKAISERANAGKDDLKADLYERAMERVQRNSRTAEQLAQDIADAQGQLELIANVNPAVVQRYTALQSEVANLKRELQRQQDSFHRSREQIDRLHREWYPEVQKIVETVGTNFSEAMDAMGCLGEVAIAEELDYAKWAVKIRVAFRDKESLQDLDGQRQSGGERSLSTMLYLISLLELSKVPFSLVDEINQGMDQRAERAVHNQLVHAVCEKEDVGQYFVITPKLLTNLNYHERIKILCVNNGEWLPEKLPLGRIIARKLASKMANR